MEAYAFKCMYRVGKSPILNRFKICNHGFKSHFMQVASLQEGPLLIFFGAAAAANFTTVLVDVEAGFVEQGTALKSDMLKGSS